MKVTFIFGQKHFELISNKDSLLSENRKNASKIFLLFDSLKTPKILYSIHPKYILMYQTQDNCNLLYFTINVLGCVEKKRSIILNSKQEKKIFFNAFDKKYYQKDVILNIKDSKAFFGLPSYFIIKDEFDVTLGEYCLPALISPAPLPLGVYDFILEKILKE